MAYDYSSESRSLELPNPYRVQNLFLLLCAALLVAGGGLALWWARQAWQGQGVVQALAPLIVSVGLLTAGLAFAVAAARRLRFFFGRGRPASLAPEIDGSSSHLQPGQPHSGAGQRDASLSTLPRTPGAPAGAPGSPANQANLPEGSTPATAEALKQLMRQGGLPVAEPQGALNGLLYHALPRLITAPAVVQALAQRHFFNALSFIATAISFAVAWLAFGTEATRPLISLVYLVFAAFMLLRPLLSGSQARMGPLALIALVVAAVLGPLAAAALGKALPPVQFAAHSQVATLLACATVAVLLMLWALTVQVDASPRTERSCEQSTLTMNGPPGALLVELDRVLQAQWAERIPNRRYSRKEPDVMGAAGSGRFEGEALEETQPLPQPGAAPQSLGAALASQRHLPLVLLDLLGTVLVILAVFLTLSYVRSFNPSEAVSQAYAGGLARHAPISHALIALMVAAFAFRSASAIWGRFNFESVLLWVEMQGVWQSSRVATGNVHASHIQTQNDVVRVEQMTLRVWRARVESVVFGKDGARQVMALFGTSEEAKRLSQQLAEVANQQSVFISPRANEDQRRIEALHAADGLLAGGAAAQGVHAARAASGTPTDASTAAAATSHDSKAGSAQYALACPTCRAQVASAQRFCAACGQRLLPG